MKRRLLPHRGKASFFIGNYLLEDPTRSSFPRKRESRAWIPAFAGITRKICLRDHLVRNSLLFFLESYALHATPPRNVCTHPPLHQSADCSGRTAGSAGDAAGLLRLRRQRPGVGWVEGTGRPSSAARQKSALAHRLSTPGNRMRGCLVRLRRRPAGMRLGRCFFRFERKHDSASRLRLVGLQVLCAFVLFRPYPVAAYFQKCTWGG